MNSDISSPDLLPPYEIIFSCAICQKTITELYRKPRTDHGFSSGSDQERVVTRLWLSECGHLTCSDHLEGGGLPFHPHGQRPSAPCPLCVFEKNDTAPRLMYSIHGPHPDEHDKNIPKQYFEIPPMEMNESNNSASALRFQYLSLLRFGGMMAKRCRNAERERKVAEARAEDLSISLQDTRKESAELRARVEELRKTERKYTQYKKREPEIRHHLGNVAGLARENNYMKHELKRLGFDVPRTTWSFQAQKPGADIPEGLQKQHGGTINDDSGAVPQHEVSHLARERAHGEDHDVPEGHFMPPPAMAPPPAPRHSRPPKLPVEMYSAGGWRNAHTSDEGVSLPINRASGNSEVYNMSSALPPSQTHAQESQTVRTADFEVTRQQWPVLASRTENVHNGYAPSAFHQDPRVLYRVNQHDSTRGAPMQEQIPMQESSRSPAMRQSFQPMPGRDHVQKRDSGYHSVANDYVTENLLPTRDSVIAPAVQPASRMMSKVMESPFFQALLPQGRKRVPTPMQQRNSTRVTNHEQLVGGLDHMQMDIDVRTPPKTRSLNTLSFIQEPYSQSNKPVFPRPESRAVWPRAPASRQNQLPSMQRGPQVSYIQDPRMSRPSAIMGPPAFTNGSHQISSRSSNNQFTGFRGVKGSSLAGPSYNNHQMGVSSNVPRFPYQQQRGLNTASGRRSVRR